MTYLNYDRPYVKGKIASPEPDTNVVWHIDHMCYNFELYHRTEINTLLDVNL